MRPGFPARPRRLAALGLSLLVAIAAGQAMAAPRPATPPLVVTPFVAQPSVPGLRVPAAALAKLSTGGATAAPLGQGVLKGTVIAVDPGHAGVWAPWVGALQVPMGGGKTKGCNTSGTQSRSGYPEHALTWDVAVRLTAMLRANGATVVLTRPHDKGTGPCVNERAAIPNRAKASMLISLHGDGDLSPTARGFHVIRSTAMAGGKGVVATSTTMAVAVRDAFAQGTGLPRSTYLGAGTGITPRNDIAGLNLLTVPGVMVEMGNMRHPVDAALMGKAQFRHQMATALLKGVVAGLGAR